MEDRIRSLVAELFRDAPRSGKTLELRDEMEQNLLDRYNDLISEGRSPDDAFEEVRSSVGDMGELFEEIERSSVYERRAYGEPERTPEAPASEPTGQKTNQPAASEVVGQEGTQSPAPEASGQKIAQTNASEAVGQEGTQSPAPETVGQESAQPAEEPNIPKAAKSTAETNIPEKTQSAAETNIPKETQSAGEAPSVGGSEPPRHGEPGAATYGAPTASPMPDVRYGSGAARGSMPAKRRRKIAGSLIGAMWCLVTALYFIVSFATGAWHVTWIMFLIGASLSCVITYFAGERGSDGRRRAGALNGAMWCLITALYFIMSFQTGAWGMTWLIFLVGACLSSIVGLIASKGDPRAMWRAINGSFWSIVVLLYLAVSFATGLWYLTWVIFLVAAAVTNVMSIFRGEKE